MNLARVEALRSRLLGFPLEAAQNATPLPRDVHALEDLLASDWAAYPATQDRVDAERLAHNLKIFPTGFRSYWVRDAEGRWLPAGYLGIHPIGAAAFSKLRTAPQSLQDREFTTAVAAVEPGGAWYVFNFSVAPTFRQSPTSRRVVADLRERTATLEPLCAIAVSAEGRGICASLGMEACGEFECGGAVETVFVRSATCPPSLPW